MDIATGLDTDQSVPNLESTPPKGLAKQDSTKFTKLKRVSFIGVAPLIFSMLMGSTAYAQTPQPKALTFNMVRSAGVVNAGCLPNGSAKVSIRSKGSVEIMDVAVKGLPPNTSFVFFVIQVPNGPFGLSWYQGDIDTNAQGVGYQRFIGRFNEETSINAPGSAPAPVVHNSPPFPDATTNPPTAPVHTFHLGLWFDSPADALTAGCPNTVTPFNGDHTAGIQVLNTSNFPDGEGPLFQVKPLP
jgi:hypothetical protein